jgi:hypothetical protein
MVRDHRHDSAYLSQGVAALMATHNPDLAARMERWVTLRGQAARGQACPSLSGRRNLSGATWGNADGEGL